MQICKQDHREIVWEPDDSMHGIGHHGKECPLCLAEQAIWELREALLSIVAGAPLSRALEAIAKADSLSC